MEEITLVLLFALAVLVVLVRGWRSVFWTTGATNIPGPPTWPIIGNAGYFLGVRNVERALQAVTEMVKAHDAPLNRIWLGPKLLVLVKSPKYINALLTHKASSTKDDFFYKVFREVTGNGVFSRKGEPWLRMRRPMASLVLPKNINNFQDMTCRKVDSMCQDLEVKANQQPFDISPHIKLCSLEVICEAGMGMDNIEWLADDKFGLIHQIEKEIEEIFINMWSFQSMMGLKKYDPEAIKSQIGPAMDRVVDKRRTEVESLGINYMTDEPKNYTDIVLRTAEIEGMTKRETALLLTDFIAAGSDTQSIAIIVLLYLLAMHQEHQEKVYKELLGIFGHSDRNPEEDDLREMVYLDMCIKEALRHCSPPGVARAVDEDIEIDGYIIPKGAALVFTLYLTHEDPQYWERPKEFFPDHFLPEAVAKRPKGTFLPFAAGPKMCPGQLYSYQLMKTVVSTLVRRYHFTTDHKFSELKFKFLLMREPVNPLVKISKRLPLK